MLRYCTLFVFSATLPSHVINNVEPFHGFKPSDVVAVRGIGLSMPKSCIVVGCSNSPQGDPKYSYYTVPQAEPLRSVWLDFAVSKDSRVRMLKAPTVCQLHFRANCFEVETRPSPTKRRLLKLRQAPTENGMPHTLASKPAPDGKEMIELITGGLSDTAIFPSMKLVNAPTAAAYDRAIDNCRMFRGMLRSEMLYGTIPEFGPLDGTSRIDAVQLYDTMNNLPVYNPSLLQNHPVLRNVVAAVNHATEIIGAGLFKANGQKDQAEVLFDAAAATCEAAVSVALTSVAPFVQTKAKHAEVASRAAHYATTLATRYAGSVGLGNSFRGVLLDMCSEINSSVAKTNTIIAESVRVAAEEVASFTASPLRPMPGSPTCNLTPYQIVEYPDFYLMYDNKFKLPVYTHETLTPASLIKAEGVRRGTSFFEDDHLFPIFRSTSWDYKGSDFDRGHLVAAANHRMTQLAQDVTFSLANMAPQTAFLNRTIWKSGEDFVRNATLRGQSCTVINGPAYPGNDDRKIVLEMIGNDLVVPPAFFKAAAVERMDGRYDFWGWVMPNIKRPQDPAQRQHTYYFQDLETIQTVSGLPMFVDLDIVTINGAYV